MIKTIRNYSLGALVLGLMVLSFAGHLMYPELLVQDPYGVILVPML